MHQSQAFPCLFTPRPTSQIVLTVIFVAFASLSYAQNDWAINGVEADGLRYFDDRLKGFLAERDITQASVAVDYQGKLVYAKGFAQSNRDGKVNTSTRFRIASVSKPITSAAIMLLVQSGKLSLQDSLVDILDISDYSDSRLA